MLSSDTGVDEVEALLSEGGGAAERDWNRARRCEGTRRRTRRESIWSRGAVVEIAWLGLSL